MAIFVEEPGIFRLPSTYKAIFVDKPMFLRNSSTYKAVFVEEPGIFRLWPGACIIALELLVHCPFHIGTSIHF
ncbi:MAG: hypothetical protein WC910_09160, partial [Bacteroidales bacterium]